MKKLLTIFAALMIVLMLVCRVQGQVVVSGRVFEQDHATPIGGVSVLFSTVNAHGDTIGYHSVTNAAGRYERVVNDGVYWISAYAEGYQPTSWIDSLRVDSSSLPFGYDSLLVVCDTLTGVCDSLYLVYNAQTGQYDTLYYPYPEIQNINLVFDEAELCFHMEFQRIFINRLIKTLNGLIEKNPMTMFNVVFITHSPFLLSDILDSHLLYLEEGVFKGINAQKTFGANLNDLVKNSFFLKNGFIGAFAQEKIKTLVSFIKSGRQEDSFWNKDKAKIFISEVVSEPIVKESLLLLLKKEGERDAANRD